MRVKTFSQRAIFLTLLALAFTGLLRAQPCMSGWPYRTTVYVDNTLNGSTLTDFQVEVVLNTQSLVSAGKMRSDAGDIRFENKLGSALNFWVDSSTINSGATIVWVKVNKITAASLDSFYLFYGNPSATSASSGASTFLFYDGFNGGSLNPALWSNCGKSPSESGGQLSFALSNIGDESTITTLASINTPYVAEMNVANAANSYSFIGQVDAADSGFGLFYGFNGASNVMREDLITPSLTSCNTVTKIGAHVGSGSIDGDWAFAWPGKGNELANWPGGNFSRGDTTVIPPSSTYITIGAKDTAGGGTTNLLLDWVRARKYISNQPSTSLGTETGAIAIASAANSQVCAGDSIKLTAATVSGAAYKWTGPGYTSISQNPAIANASVGKSGTYTLVVTPNNGCASIPSTVSVTVSPKSVGGAVSGSATVCSGANTGKLILKGQTGNVIRWESSATGNTPWATIADTIDTLTYANLTATTYYRAIVQSGSCTIDSSTAAFVKVSPASAGGSIAGSATVCSGSNSGTLTLSGNTGNVVRWESSSSSLGPWTPIANITNTLNYTNLVSTTFFRVVVKSTPCANAISSQAEITVSPVSNAGTLSGAATVCSGSNSGTLTLSGFTGSILNWESSPTGSSPWAAVSDTTDTLNYTNLTSTMHYRAVVQSGNCASATSNIQAITVNPTSEGGTVSGSAMVCSGSNSGTLTLSGSTGTIVRWESSASSSGPWTAIANTTPTLNYTNLTSTTYYHVIIKSGVCSDATSSSAVVTVSPVSNAGTLSGAATVCSGTNSGTLTLSGFTGSILNWESSPTGSSPWAAVSDTTDTLNYTNLTNTMYYRAVVQSGSCASATSNIQAITVNPTSVGGMVSGSFSVCSGSNSGTLMLSGFTGSVVRWESSSTGSAPWASVSNTTDSLVYNNLTSTTYYRAIVQSGVCSVDSSSVARIMVNPMSVGGSVSGATTVCSGNNSGKLTLSGNTGSIVSWQSSINGSSPWTTISDTTDSLVYTNITATRYYRALLQSGNCPSATSSSALIIVNPASVGGTVRGGATVCSGANAGTLILGGFTGSVIRWESSSSATGPWTTIANTTDSLNYLNLTSTTYFRAIVQSGVCSLDSSSNGLVKVNPVTVAGTLSGSATVCSGSNSGKLTLTGYTGNITSWQSSSTGTSPWTVIADNRDSLKYTNLTSTTYYRAVVQSGNCPGDVSNTDTITVNPVSVGGMVSGSASVCSGSNSGTLMLSGFTGSILRWESSSTGSAPWTAISNTTDSLVYTNLTSATYYRAIVQSGVCSIDSSSVASIMVSPVTVAGTLSGTASVCSGSNSGKLMLTGYTGSILHWESSPTGSAPWSVISNTTDSLNYLNLTSTSYFRVVVQSGNCASAISNADTITVSPISVGGTVSGSATVCSGSNSGTLMLSGFTGSVIRWEWSATGSAPWTAYADVTDTLNYNNLTATTYYRAIVQSGVCSMDSSTIATVTVNPVTVAGTLSGSATVCSGNNSGKLTLTGYTGSIIHWESSATGTSPWNVIANTRDSLKYTNLTSTTYFRVLVQSGNCPYMESNIDTITVAPVSVGGSVSGSAKVCSGSNSGTLTLSGNTGSILYWQTSATPTGPWATISNTTDTINYTNLTTTTYYRVMVQSSPCSMDSSSVAMIMVNPMTIAGTLSGAAAVCGGNNAGILKLTGYTGMILRWETSVNGTPPWSVIADTTDTLNYKNLSYTSYYRAIVQSGVCSADSTNAVKISVSPSTVKGSVLGSNSGCSGNNSGVLTFAGYTGKVIKWQDSTATTKWTDIADTTSSYYYSNLTATTYFRAVVQSGICAILNSDSAIITINPIPTVNFSASTVCLGSATTFIDSSKIASGSIVTYAWDFGDGGSSVANNPIYTYTKPGTYNVSLKVTTNSGCVDSATKTVTVNPMPAASFTAGNVCMNDTVHFTNTSSILSGALTYRWDFGDGVGKSTAMDTTYVYASPGTYRVKLVASSGSGCSDSVYMNVTVYPRAKPAFAFNTVCYGNNVIFTNNTTISSGNMSYLWNFGDSLTSTSALTSPSHLYAAAGSYTVKLTVTSQNGCTDTISHVVTVYPQPVAAFTFTDVCYPNATQFGDSTKISSGTITRIWNFGNGDTSSAANPSYKYSAPGSYDVTLSVTSNNGCMGSVSHFVKIYSIPAASFTATNVCSTDTMSFMNTTTMQYGTATYLWVFGDGDSSKLAMPAHLYKASGTYNVMLVAYSNNNCPDTFRSSVTVYPKPVASFTVKNSCFGFPVTITNNSTISSGKIASYTWDFGDATSSTEAAPTKQYSKAGTYTISLHIVSNNGCAKDTSQTVVVNPAPVVNFDVQNACQGSTVTFDNTTTISSGSATYKWSFGDSGTSTADTATHTYIKSGLYSVMLVAKSDSGCADSVMKKVTIYPSPKAMATKDTTVSKGIPFKLYASGGETYSWSPPDSLSDPGSADPVARTFVLTKYVVKVTNAFGCSVYDTTVVNVNNDYKIIANNVLTPNGDGHNDVWKVVNLDTYNDNTVFIFDRWGKQVFTEQGYKNDWNGNNSSGVALPDGTYYYVVKFSSSSQDYTGYITLLRDKK